MEYDNQSQIAAILGEIEYIMGLLGSTFNEPARNELMERMRSMIRSIVELAASPAPWESMQEEVEPQEDEPPSQPVSLQPPEGSKQEPVRLTETRRVFTPEELALYTGSNGYPAYIAVNGIVYDVSNVPLWQTGTHFGLHAGLSLTTEFNFCHSDNPARLDAVVPVGRL